MRKLLKVLAKMGILHTTLLDGCMVGVRTPDTGEPMRKQWRIVTTSREMKEALSVRCNHQHQHAECLGHGRATASGFYPEEICRRIVRCILSPSRCTDDETMAWILGLQEEPVLSAKLEGPERKCRASPNLQQGPGERSEVSGCIS